MNTLLCAVTVLNIYSLPAGYNVVGIVPAGAPVEIQDTSTLRDYVFVGKPGLQGVSPRGWIQYGGLGNCYPTNDRTDNTQAPGE